MTPTQTFSHRPALLLLAAFALALFVGCASHRVFLVSWNPSPGATGYQITHRDQIFCTANTNFYLNGDKGDTVVVQATNQTEISSPVSTQL